MSDFNAIAKKLEQLLKQQPNQIEIIEYRPVFESLSKLIGDLIAHKLFTLTVIHPFEAKVIRLYSSEEGDYALEDSKPILNNAWTTQVISKRDVFSASSINQLKPFFPDYQKIADMGLGSVINLPICWHGECIGTINLLDIEGAYVKPKLEEILSCAQLAAPVFNAYRQLNCQKVLPGAKDE